MKFLGTLIVNLLGRNKVNFNFPTLTSLTLTQTITCQPRVGGLCENGGFFVTSTFGNKILCSFTASLCHSWLPNHRTRAHCLCLIELKITFIRTSLPHPHTSLGPWPPLVKAVYSSASQRVSSSGILFFKEKKVIGKTQRKLLVFMKILIYASCLNIPQSLFRRNCSPSPHRSGALLWEMEPLIIFVFVRIKLIHFHCGASSALGAILGIIDELESRIRVDRCWNRT